MNTQNPINCTLHAARKQHPLPCYCYYNHSYLILEERIPNTREIPVRRNWLSDGKSIASF